MLGKCQRYLNCAVYIQRLSSSSCASISRKELTRSRSAIKPNQASKLEQANSSHKIPPQSILLFQILPCTLSSNDISRSRNNSSHPLFTSPIHLKVRPSVSPITKTPTKTTIPSSSTSTSNSTISRWGNLRMRVKVSQVRIKSVITTMGRKRKNLWEMMEELAASM
jgi:hypothetical protein